MRYGIRWYTSVGEHNYEETRTGEFDSVSELFDALVAVAKTFASEDLLFDAFTRRRQEMIYWLTDDLGFVFYRPG